MDSEESPSAHLLCSRFFPLCVKMPNVSSTDIYSNYLFFNSSGTPMNIEFYISPYQLLEAELNPGKARKAEVTFSALPVSLNKGPC